jgi:hypothetical protein
MVEHLFCKQAVAGSNPIAGSILVLPSVEWHEQDHSWTRLIDEAAPQEFDPGVATAVNHSRFRTHFLPDGVMVAQTTLTRFV